MSVEPAPTGAPVSRRTHVVLRRVGIAAGALALLVVVVLGSAFGVTRSRLHNPFEPPVAFTNVAATPELVAAGEHVMRVHACQECHGQRLEGRLFEDIPPGRIIAPNLTRGRGGVGAAYDDAAWDRAIRYGVRANGTQILPFMPWQLFHHIGDEDMKALVAYLKTLPAVDNEVGTSRLRVPGYLMMASPEFSPKKVRALLETPPPVRPVPGPTAEYGKYLAGSSCVECHGHDLRGGKHPNPSAPPVPGLVQYADIPFERFASMIRDGVGYDGRKLTPFMPAAYMAHHTDVELMAIQQYLRTLK